MNRMRRIANWIDFFVSLLAAVFLGSFVIALNSGNLVPASPAVRGQESTIVYLGIFLAVLLLLGAAIRAVQNVARTLPRRYLHFETPSGRVAVSAPGVEAVVNRALRDMDEVADASASLVMAPDADLPSEIRIRCRLYDRPNILAIQDQIRAVVAQRYEEMFPSEEPTPAVQISVENIVFETPGPKEAPKETTSPADEQTEEEQPPFRPQYPVEE
ncbi:MAG: hypothetical protein ACLF0G_14140 [Candidatus Brocadiia bacterium]